MAIRLTGAQYLNLADAAALTFPAGPYTLMGWVRFPSGISGSFDYLFGWGSYGASPSFNLFAYSSNDNLTMVVRDGAGGGYSADQNIATDFAVPTGWQHFALRRGAAGAREMFVDGTSVWSDTGTSEGAINVSGDARVGANSSGSDGFEVDVYDWGKYDSAISDAVIATAAAGGGRPSGAAWEAAWDTTITGTGVTVTAPSGSSTTDNPALGSFTVSSVTGTVARGGTVTITGTSLDVVDTVSIRTDDGTYTDVQSILAQNATTITFAATLSNVPLTNAGTHDLEVRCTDTDTSFDVDTAIVVSPPTGHTLVTTSGTQVEAGDGTSLHDVIAGVGAAGQQITYSTPTTGDENTNTWAVTVAVDGTFVVAGGVGVDTFTARHWDPSNGWGSAFTVQLRDSALEVAVGDAHAITRNVTSNITCGITS